MSNRGLPIKKIGIYGGSFDPPHLAHVQVMENALRAGLADEIWIVPTGEGRYDRKSAAGAEIRREMVEAMLKENFPGKPVRVEPVQLDGKIPDSSTMDLIDYLRRAHPDARFLFIVGADLVPQIPSWRQADRLAREVEFLAHSRGKLRPARSNLSVIEIPGETEDLSSSDIRARVAGGNEISSLVPASVAAIISRRGLYR